VAISLFFFQPEYELLEKHAFLDPWAWHTVGTQQKLVFLGQDIGARRNLKIISEKRKWSPREGKDWVWREALWWRGVLEMWAPK
jgi:hypothetical protein